MVMVETTANEDLHEGIKKVLEKLNIPTQKSADL
jgi:hypothetical protein